MRETVTGQSMLCALHNNMTHFFQPLDLTVNVEVKHFIKGTEADKPRKR